MSVDFGRFASAEDEFVVRFRREDLPGLLRKRLDVPAGTIALVRADAGAVSVLSAAGSTDDVREGFLVKESCRLELALDAGRSKDDLAFRVSVGLALRPRASAIDLQQLERALLRDKPRLSRGDVRAFLEPYVRDAARFFASQRTAEDLAARDQRAALEAHLQEELKKPLFELGCALHDVVHPTFASEAYEARRQASAEAAAKAKALEHEGELLELKKGLDRQALLAGIEIRDEADRARKERRLKQYEDLRARMGDDDVKALVMMLEDDGQRARLIKELIDKDLTPEQRAKVQLSEMEGRVESRLRELQERMASLVGGGLSSTGQDPITRRILCVVGKRVLSFDPKTNLHPEVPKEVYDTEGGALGYLRSVRTDRVDRTEYVLAGAQRGVYRLTADARKEYPFPVEPEGKGGANAVAYFDGRVYATHSEMGLYEWPVEGGAGRAICADATRGQSATRGALVADGRLYFSAGSDVFSVDLATGSDKPTRYKGSDDSVTAFVVQGDELVAGNRAGKIYRWHLDDPTSPQAFNVLKKNPIYMLRHARIAGHGFYVIGSKDFTVTAAEPRRDVYREYQAREEVRWVDGAADFVVGVSRSGYKVFAWDAHHQTEPRITIRVADKVQDLFVSKMMPVATA